MGLQRVTLWTQCTYILQVFSFRWEFLLSHHGWLIKCLKTIFTCSENDFMWTVFILLNIKPWVPFWKYVSVPQLPRCSADMIRLKLAQRTLSAGDKTGLSGGTETMVWISVWAYALMSASKLWRLERVENSQRFSPFLSPFVFGCLWALQWFEKPWSQVADQQK